MTRIVETTFSKYEIDTTNSRIRRLEGSAEPTERQGPDGVWKYYTHLSKVQGGYLIEWDDEGRATLTSRIVNEYEGSLA